MRPVSVVRPVVMMRAIVGIMSVVVGMPFPTVFGPLLLMHLTVKFEDVVRRRRRPTGEFLRWTAPGGPDAADRARVVSRAL